MDAIVLLLIILLLTINVVLFMLFLQQRQAQASVAKQTQKALLALFNERLFQLEKTLQHDMHTTQTTFAKQLRDDFTRLDQNLEQRVRDMQNQVDAKLNKSLKETTETFQSVLTRLTKIDQAQKRIDDLSTNIGSLQDILNDKKARGAFGEVQLVNIFKSVFGVNEHLYKTQHTLSNFTKVDLMLFAPEPMGNVAIDSKFPFENYRRMLDAAPGEVAVYEKQFKTDVKKHIDDIANKYIIANETADYAIMFLPAEAVFAQINAYHSDIIEYGYKRNVWLTSPTTLMALLTTLQVVLKNIERDKYARVIREELQRLSLEFTRYQSRWQALAKHIEQVSNDVRAVNITSDKIISRFSQIESVEFDKQSPALADDLLTIENLKEE
jgi:DNA recombination protein RmuC